MTQSKLKVYLDQLEVKNDHECLIIVAEWRGPVVKILALLSPAEGRGGDAGSRTLAAPGATRAEKAGIWSSTSVWKSQQQNRSCSFGSLLAPQPYLRPAAADPLQWVWAVLRTPLPWWGGWAGTGQLCHHTQPSPWWGPGSQHPVPVSLHKPSAAMWMLTLPGNELPFPKANVYIKHQSALIKPLLWCPPESKLAFQGKRDLWNNQSHPLVENEFQGHWKVSKEVHQCLHQSSSAFLWLLIRTVYSRCRMAQSWQLAASLDCLLNHREFKRWFYRKLFW